MPQSLLRNEEQLMSVEREALRIYDSSSDWRREEAMGQFRMSIEIVVTRPVGKQKVKYTTETDYRVSRETPETVSEFFFGRSPSGQFSGDDVSQ